MKLANFWTGLDWDNWSYSLIKGLISAGAGSANAALAALAVDPSHFAFGTPDSWKMIEYTFLFGAVTFTFAFLSKSGLPEKKREETLQVSQRGDQPPMVIKTTKDISTVPIDQPPTPIQGTGDGTVKKVEMSPPPDK
jgi:hypothetical protein